MPKVQYSKELKQEIIDAYNNGQSLSEISRRHNLSRDPVRKILKDAGVYEKPDKTKLYDRVLSVYAETGENIARTSSLLGLDKETVKRVLGASNSTTIVDPEQTMDIETVSKGQRFVITSALNNCDIDTDFLACLITYCEVNNAQLIVIPVHYKNISLFSGAYEPWWPPELQSYYVKEDLELSSNCVIMGSMRIQATASKPLSSTGGIAKGKSAIFGHPRIALETVATPLKKFPLVYATSGTISEASYSETKVGRLGEFHHTKAAMVVESDGEKFWWRHIHAPQKVAGKEPTIYDLNYTYTAKKAYWSEPTVDTVIVGDIHVGFHDKQVTDSVLSHLVPLSGAKNVVLHDVLDFFSASHHDTDNKVLQTLKYLRGRSSVSQELASCARFFDTYCNKKEVDYYVIQSNHHDHLSKWLDTNSSKVAPENLYLWHRLNAKRLEKAESLFLSDPEDNDWSTVSPFQLSMEELCKEAKLIWPDDREPLEFHGIDCSQHGHRGPNGSRGSRGGFARVQRKTFLGHSHSPGITDGCFQVGMSCRADLPYTGGYSSWFTVSGIIYKDGSRTLFPIIDGKYKL